MINPTPQSDERLHDLLAGLSRSEEDYWSFKGKTQRQHGHGLAHYPAMMVPQVAGAILRQARDVHPEIEKVGDPFVGAGTILTESMLQGLSFSGTDVNPLAILICRVKAGPFFITALTKKLSEVVGRIDSDSGSDVDVDFPNREKWFSRDVSIALSKIRRGILRESSLWARRFFWLGIAEAVRLTSNSRTSTFKLHVRPEEEIRDRVRDPVQVFTRAITRNLNHMKTQATFLKEKGHLSQGHYAMDVNISLGDTRKVEDRQLRDVILTSPPYGDNTSTVPYGQYSYLQLQWIEMADIDPDADSEYLRSTCEIDARSLGGSKQIDSVARESLTSRSPSFAQYVEKLAAQPADRAKRVTAYFRDLDDCLGPILSGLRPGGLMVWTLGNRKVGGERVPLDRVLSELLAGHAATVLCTLSRRISSKQMAFKNNVTEMMSREVILVMRKAF